MHNDTFTWNIKDTNAVCGTNWGTANCRGNAHGSAVLSTLRRLPSLSKPSVMREDSQWLCIICGVIKSPLMLWVTRSFPFSLTIVSKHCLLNYFFLIPFLAKAQLDDLRDFWNLISEWGDPVPRRQVASFSVLHTNTALDFFFFASCFVCERKCPLSTVAVHLFPCECLPGFHHTALVLVVLGCCPLLRQRVSSRILDPHLY